VDSGKRYFVKGVVPGIHDPVILVIRAKSKKRAIARALANYNISEVLEVRDRPFEREELLRSKSKPANFSVLNGHRKSVRKYGRRVI